VKAYKASLPSTDSKTPHDRLIVEVTQDGLLTDGLLNIYDARMTSQSSNAMEVEVYDRLVLDAEQLTWLKARLGEIELEEDEFRGTQYQVTVSNDGCVEIDVSIGDYGFKRKLPADISLAFARKIIERQVS
jgi:hypothetical protein